MSGQDSEGEARAYAERLEEINAALIALLEGCSPAEWVAVGPRDARSVGVLAHHVALGYPSAVGLVMALTTSQPLPAVTAEAIDRINARHAARYAGCPKGPTIDLLHANGAAAAAAIAGLRDEDLTRGAAFELLGGHRASVRRLIETLVLGHPREHLAGIRAALACAPRSAGGIGGI